MTSITLDKTHVPPIDFIDVDEPDNNFDDFYCIRVTPYKCECGTWVEFVQPCLDNGPTVVEMHLVVIWPESDHPIMLEAAAFAMRSRSNPKIIAYEKSYGACIEFKDGMALAVRIGDG